MAEENDQLHIADLHARAAEEGVEGYRLMRREELLERLEGTEPKPRRRSRRGGRGRGGRERLDADKPRRERGGGRAERDNEPADDDGPTVEVTGVLELTRQRHGFIRARGLAARDDDVYVSASQIRRCELLPGDEVSGPAREPRRGERHRALIHVDTVNGAAPTEEDGRPDFDSLTPAPATRRIPLASGAGTLVRAADLLAPVAYGHRALVRATPRSGRTTLLRELAAAVADADNTRVIVLLVDERPEELPAWQGLPETVELALAPADLAPRDQVRVAELAIARGRRLAEAGTDAVLLCDSLSRLTIADDGVAVVKRLFGSGRELSDEGAGSLTVVATAFAEGEDEGSAERAVSTTETALVALDETLAEEGIVPALRFGDCRVVGEEEILGDAHRAGLQQLRRELRDRMPPEAAAYLRELIESNDSNDAVYESLA